MTKPRLLIVDDEPDMLDFLERVFRADYQIQRASSGEDALRAVMAERFDVLITDHKMPRLTGLELIERIGDGQPQLVRVLISGFTDVPEVEKLVQSRRIDTYVVKPVDSEKLRAAVDEAIRAR